MNYLEPYVTDEVFLDLAEEWADVEQLMDYYCFAQACSLGGDNVFNNLYIWLQRDSNGDFRYRFSPWDMDRSFNTKVDGMTVDDLDLQMAWFMTMERFGPKYFDANTLAEAVYAAELVGKGLVQVLLG